MLELVLLVAFIVLIFVLAVLTVGSLFVIFISGGDTQSYLDGVDLDPDN
jgi:hypothetical protein